MPRVLVLLVSVLFTFLPGISATQGQSSEAGSPAPRESRFRRTSGIRIPNRYIVVLNENVARSNLSSTAASLTTPFRGRIHHVYDKVLGGFSVELSEEQAMAVSEDPRVAFVEEDSAVILATTQTNPGWGLDRIDQRNLPVNNGYVYDNTGAGVDVYVIDTGIRGDHQEFLNSAGTASRVMFGTDTVGDNANGADLFDHGTGVAGIIGGRLRGAAKDATLWNVRVVGARNLPAGSPAYAVSNFTAGVNWVTANHLARPGIPAVANVSLQYAPKGSANRAVRDSISTGVTFVIAAGNNSANANGYTPSMVVETVTVAATGAYNVVPGTVNPEGCPTNLTAPETDQRASFSNYGMVVDLFAPGVKIKMPSKSSPTAMMECSGTSFAAPYASGVAALYLQTNPLATPKTVRKALKSNASNVVTFPGDFTTTKLLYSRFNFSAVVTSGCDSNEQTVCIQQGGVWNSSTCSCDIPIGVDPEPCPTCQ